MKKETDKLPQKVEYRDHDEGWDVVGESKSDPLLRKDDLVYFTSKTEQEECRWRVHCKVYDVDLDTIIYLIEWDG